MRRHIYKQRRELQRQTIKARSRTIEQTIRMMARDECFLLLTQIKESMYFSKSPDLAELYNHLRHLQDDLSNQKRL